MPELYADWALTEGERLQTLYLENLETVARRYQKDQKIEEAKKFWQSVLKIIPWHEQAHRALMTLSMLRGNRAAALHQYDEYCTILKKELNANPLPEMQTLYEELRLGKSLTSSLEQTRALPAELPFIGRQQEYELMKTLWQKATQSQGQAVFIAGEAGVGKTTLVQHLITHSLPSARVLAGGAYALGKDLPYQLILQALREGVRQLSREALEKIPALWRSGLIPFIPELQEQFPELKPHLESSQPQEKARWFTALTIFFERFAQEHPTILFLDDLQWADEASLDYLGHLLVHIPKLPFLLIGTYRAEAATEKSALRAWLDKIGPGRSYQPLRLSRFSLEETQLLLERWLGSELRSALPLLYDETEGNPLFLRELVRSLWHRGAITRDARRSWQLTLSEVHPAQFPETLRELIQASLRRAPERERWLLTLASVVGREFDLSILKAISRHSEASLLRALDALRQAGLIVEDSGHYRFYHEMFRQVIYDELGADRQRIYHRQVGEALEKFYSSQLDERAGELAEHFERARLWEKTIAYAMRAGAQAQQIYAYGEALKRYSKALKNFENLKEPLSPRQKQMKLTLLSHYTSPSVFPTISDLIPAIKEMQNAVLQMIALAQELRDTTKICESYQRQARVALAQGHREAAQAALRRALELSAEIPDASVTTILEQIGRLYRQLGEYSPALEAYRRMAQAGATLQNLGVQGKALADCAVIQLFLGQWDEALRHMEQAHELVHASGNQRLQASVLNNLGVILWRLGHYERARTRYEQAYRLMNEVKDQRGLGITLLNLGTLASDHGQYEKALDYFQRVFDLLNLVGLKGLEIETLSEQSRTHLGLGQLSQALDCSTRAIGILEAERGIATEAQRFYFTHFQILKANQRMGEAKIYVQKAYDELQRVAAEIREETLRKSFLENVQTNSQIVRAWENEQG